MTTRTDQQNLSLALLAEQIGATLIGDGSVFVYGVNTIQDASADEVCFLSSSKHAKGLANTQAAGVIVRERFEGFDRPQLVVDNVDRALIEAMTLFAPKLKGFEGIHPTAIVEADAQLDSTVVVGPHAYIAQGVTIGPGTLIGVGCSIGENTTIGAQCRLDNHVVVYHNCKIGNACVIQANATIGSTGFGYSFVNGQHRLIPHNGGVILEDGVEIGANSCVDRAKFGNTVIGAGTKIDNLVQVAHNVQMGKLCLLAAGVGIAGSARIGNGVVFAGHSGAADNMTIGDQVTVCAKTAVTRDIPVGQAVMGTPPQEMHRELRCKAVYHRLPEMAKEIKQLHQKVESLEAAKDD